MIYNTFYLQLLQEANLMIRLAINGYGRIGRNILRAYYERPELADKIKIVAINDLGDVSINAHLTQYDSVQGRFSFKVGQDKNHLIINGDNILVTSERDPSKLPWLELDIDIVCECTGLFTDRESANRHILAGAKKVIVSAPGKDLDATIVFGINDDILSDSHQIISNASCTTNCLAPLIKPLDDELGVRTGIMTTIHSFTNDQNLTDTYHQDVYRARAATSSLIPTKTGAASAIGLVLPSLEGKLDGLAIRVPTLNVSLVDLTFTANRETSVTEVNSILRKAAEGPLRDILSYNDIPLVSVDFNHTPYSCIFDASHTRVNGNFVKVLAWYDNEWGFSNRMLDNSLSLFARRQCQQVA